MGGSGVGLHEMRQRRLLWLSMMRPCEGKKEVKDILVTLQRGCHKIGITQASAPCNWKFFSKRFQFLPNYEQLSMNQTFQEQDQTTRPISVYIPCSPENRVCRADVEYLMGYKLKGIMHFPYFGSVRAEYQYKSILPYKLREQRLKSTRVIFRPHINDRK